MIENYRHFTAGPDPFGRTWDVRFRWLQTGISIRHADTVDVKFTLSSRDSEAEQEKVVALPHPGLLALSERTRQPLNDAWCLRLAALHLRQMILTAEDMEKTLITVSPVELAERQRELESAEPVARR